VRAVRTVRTERPSHASRTEPSRGAATDRDERIITVIVMLRVGEVASYGDIAAIAGHPGSARLVGRLLRDRGEDLPWWRVVTATGRLVPGAEAEQTALLQLEGVDVRDGRVVGARSGRFAG
jgi:methylated-DNA-protein-cysteine methyltransferase-like protein